MYYLARFCRICIQTGGELTDIESRDYDSIKFSEKLKACTEMVITRESLSTEVCTSCIQKLRISYQFQNMCKKSTSILQQYLAELLSVSEGITADKFLNSDLRVDVSPKLPKAKRKRVSKDQRCSLLKKLLSKITQEQIVHNIHINGLEVLCNRIRTVKVDKRTHLPPPKQDLEKRAADESHKHKCKPGGLRDLLHFAHDFDFGYDITTCDKHCNNFDLTPLEQLTKFTETFFYDHFGDYRETILNASDNFNFDSSDDDDEDMFEQCMGVDNAYEAHPAVHIKKEIVIVQPDIDFHRDLFYNEDDTTDYGCTSRFVQVCYDNNESNIKSESEENVPCQSSNSRRIGNYVLRNKKSARKTSMRSTMTTSIHQNSYPGSSQNSNPNFLKQVENSISVCFKKCRTLSSNSVKCRTRGNLFISPQLKKQFQTRNFKCSTCNRRFKSPGFLKAHCTRLKH